MTTDTFVITSQEDLYRISEAASQEDYPIYISGENFMLDAKSLLALFTIIGKEIKLVAPDHANANDFMKFINSLSE